MRYLLIILAFLSAKAFAQENKLWKTIYEDKARGFDSLVGMSGEKAIEMMAKFHPTKLSERNYPFIKEVYRIENFNKWQNSATLYVFFDSSDQVCKLNYFFNRKLDARSQKSIIDSIWGFPQEHSSTPEHIEGEPRQSICNFGKEQYFKGEGTDVHDSSWKSFLWRYPPNSHVFCFLDSQPNKVVSQVLYSTGIDDPKYHSKDSKIFRSIDLGSYSSS